MMIFWQILLNPDSEPYHIFYRNPRLGVPVIFSPKQILADNKMVSYVKNLPLYFSGMV